MRNSINQDGHTLEGRGDSLVVGEGAGGLALGKLQQQDGVASLVQDGMRHDAQERSAVPSGAVGEQGSAQPTADHVHLFQYRAADQGR